MYERIHIRACTYITNITYNITQCIHAYIFILSHGYVNASILKREYLRFQPERIRLLPERIRLLPERIRPLSVSGQPLSVSGHIKKMAPLSRKITKKLHGIKKLRPERIRPYGRIRSPERIRLHLSVSGSYLSVSGSCLSVSGSFNMAEYAQPQDSQPERIRPWIFFLQNISKLQYFRAGGRIRSGLMAVYAHFGRAGRRDPGGQRLHPRGQRRPWTTTPPRFAEVFRVLLTYFFV